MLEEENQRRVFRAGFLVEGAYWIVSVEMMHESGLALLQVTETRLNWLKETMEFINSRQQNVQRRRPGSRCSSEQSHEGFVSIIAQLCFPTIGPTSEWVLSAQWSQWLLELWYGIPSA